MTITKKDKINGNYHCPTCSNILVPTPGTMFYQGKMFPGLVCSQCNALYDNPDKSMFAYAEKMNAKRRDK